MLLRHSLDLEDEATAIEKAVEGKLSAGLRTADLCREGENHVPTRDFTEAVIQALD
jgi:3-isopropylmalate dehydrogenase